LTSRADEVYVALRNELLLGRWGYARLAEEALAERFSTSRTPVREALRRLEGDGHVERHPKMGLVPSPPRVGRMHELYEVRIVLEELVARRLSRAPAHASLENLLRAWEDMRAPEDLPSFVYSDEGFHIGLAEASGHTVATALLGDINDRIRVLRIHDFVTVERVETTIREHVAILSALLDRDTETAVRLLRGNIEHSAAVVEQRVGEAHERMFTITARGAA
jgi:DNA-binding GntR family transcriptional regulator